MTWVSPPPVADNYSDSPQASCSHPEGRRAKVSAENVVLVWIDGFGGPPIFGSSAEWCHDCGAFRYWRIVQPSEVPEEAVKGFTEWFVPERPVAVTRAPEKEEPHDILVLRVEPNEDPLLTCMLCHRESTELCTTYLTPDGSTTSGLHRGCYERAQQRRKPWLTPEELARWAREDSASDDAAFRPAGRTPEPTPRCNGNCDFGVPMPSVDPECLEHGRLLGIIKRFWVKR